MITPAYRAPTQGQRPVTVASSWLGVGCPSGVWQAVGFQRGAILCDTMDKHQFLKAIMTPKLLIDILGWTGSVLYLLAYALVSLKKTEGDSVLYQGINIFAGVLLVIYTLSLGAFATTGLNAGWVAIGLFTLGRKWLIRN
jgi:hypothetical protein